MKRTLLWGGRDIDKMTREELIDALVTLGALYNKEVQENADIKKSRFQDFLTITWNTGVEI